MFSFLLSEQKKLRQSAENWLEMADRVHKFRRDLLKPEQNEMLLAAVGDVRMQLREKSGPERLKPAIETLEKALRTTGGRIYPVSSLVENVEFFLVAAIVILGLRAYFIQPFKIPTNSMWPSYYGMTADYFTEGHEPGLLRRLGRLATLGATHYALKAPADGEIMVPVFRNGQVAFTEKAGRSLFVFPTDMREYTFMVAGKPVTVDVPTDWARSEYGFDYIVQNCLFPGHPRGLYDAILAAGSEASKLERSTYLVQGGSSPQEATVYWVPLGKTVHRGEHFLSFDILTGDLLFVDRLTYNFVPPKVGSGFVFRTGNIPALKEDEGDKYFVKRLVGGPGDRLEIRKPAAINQDGAVPADPKDGQLYRNGKPIEGAAAFAKNARKEGLYPGYTAEGNLSFGNTVTVPPKSYFALGDNSPRSKDSRYWDYVPEKDVVGRPLFIYYPLTSRWGPAH